MFVEGLGGCAPAKTFAGSVVDRSSDRRELATVPTGEVGALREVLAQQPVGVLVRASLPWAVRVGEEHRDAGLGGELGVLGEFFAAIPGEGSAQIFGQLQELPGERESGCFGAVSERVPAQEHSARGSRPGSANRRCG